MEKNHPIARFVHGFFHCYLGAQRGLSTHTIASYRDGLKLLFQFAAQRIRIDCVSKANHNLIRLLDKPDGNRCLI